MDVERQTDGRRTDTQGQWSRVLWLDREVRSGAYPNVQQLQEEFGVRRRTAFNTVTFLRDSLGAPLSYSREKRGYFYADATYGLPAVFLQEGELLAILLAEQVSRQYLGTPLEAPLRGAIEKISRYLPETVKVHLGDLADSYQFIGGSGTELPAKLLAELHGAIRDRKLVHIRYYAASRGEESEREIEPHFLTNMRGDWMVVAWDPAKDTDRVFKLARIREWRVLDRQFQRRPDLDPEMYSEPMFMGVHTAETHDVALRFDNYQARWIRERIWHRSQRIEEQDDGGVVLRLSVAGGGDIVRWVLSYGSHVEVMEPEWLRESVAAEARQAAALYAPDTEPCRRPTRE